MEPQWLEDVLTWEAEYPEALVGNGLLYQQLRMIIYGRYKSLKSMLAMNLSFCVGTAVPRAGFSTAEAGARVLYLQIEMPHAFMKKRLVKVVARWDGPVPEKQIGIWTEPYIKLDDRGAGVSLLDRQLTKLKPALLIIDPLYKVMSGNILDPNAVRGFLDQLDIMIAKHGCAVVLVSHTRKGLYEEWGSDDLLGSVFLSAWADTVIRVSRKEGDSLPKQQYIPISLNFDVLRHAEEPIEDLELLFDMSTLKF